jgi:inner membrane protein
MTDFLDSLMQKRGIPDLIEGLGTWTWFILGALLLAIEIMAPGTFILWLGFSAILVGLISLLVDWSWQAQLVAFAVLAVLSLVAWRRFGQQEKAKTDQPFLNRRTEAMVGRIFTLERPIVDGTGSVRIDDTIWRVMGPDCPAGSRVRIAGADGATLVVDRADA